MYPESEPVKAAFSSPGPQRGVFVAGVEEKAALQTIARARFLWFRFSSAQTGPVALACTSRVEAEFAPRMAEGAASPNYAKFKKTHHPPERWPSGLRRTLGKRVYFNEYRGFESHSLRQAYLYLVHCKRKYIKTMMLS
jgi:hypothetical protein